MIPRIARTLRFVDHDSLAPSRAAARDLRSPSERLADTLALHREGNLLFKGGNPPFSFRLRYLDVAPR